MQLCICQSSCKLFADTGFGPQHTACPHNLGSPPRSTSNTAVGLPSTEDQQEDLSLTRLPFLFVSFPPHVRGTRHHFPHGRLTRISYDGCRSAFSPVPPCLCSSDFLGSAFHSHGQEQACLSPKPHNHTRAGWLDKCRQNQAIRANNECHFLGTHYVQMSCFFLFLNHDKTDNKPPLTLLR